MTKNIIISFLVMLSFFINGCEQKTQTNTQDQNKTTQTEVQEDLIETGIISDGAKIFRDEMQKSCNMSGYTLARKNTKSEWKMIAENGEFAKTIKTICPEVEFNDNWTPDIYEFVHKNALNS